MNLQKFPGMRGDPYNAELSDASGLHQGNMVQIAGIRVGRVGEIELAGDKVIAHFTVDGGREFGSDSTASMEVLNLLGEKFLNLKPAGGSRSRRTARSRWQRTDASYDIVKVFTGLSDTTENIKIPQLQKALGMVGDTMDRTSDEAGATFDGLSRLSQTIASRDQELQALLERAELGLPAAGRPQGRHRRAAQGRRPDPAGAAQAPEAIHALLVGTADAVARARRPGRRQPGADRSDAREPARR